MQNEDYPLKIAILTSKNQWFEEYAEELSEKLGAIPIFKNHKELNKKLDILFILSYHQKIENDILKKNKYNLVIHGSDLPRGKGWAPLFWQILEGKNEIKFSMIEASSEIDSGEIYMQRNLRLSGYELNEELRFKQAKLIIEMCTDILEDLDLLSNPYPQVGDSTFFKKRNPSDSQLDINKTILEQFNLLRISNNQEYPAFFEIDNHRFILKIEEGTNE